ncbi:MAG: tetratricopeptide repeat protein, partial [Planctomycetota bacterium]
EYDAECFQCHTVGFAQPGGFMQPSAAQHFENVQCAACHGAGAAHMAGGESYVDPSNLLPIGSTCRNCHTKEHDPNFDSWVHEPERYAQALQAKVLAVSCPKMPEMGAGNSAFNASLVEAAKDVLAHGQEVRWDLASRLFVRAGDLEKGIAAAKRAVEAGGERPEDLRMYALTLLRAGRTDAADRAIERALADLPTDAELHFDLALLRLESNPESALVHAREAYSLDPANAVFTECVVRALVATGDSVEARRFLEKHLAQQPQNHELLDPLLEELPPE